MESTQRESDCLPCPFCGGSDFGAVLDREEASIVCHNCLAMGPVAMTLYEAEAAWNERCEYASTEVYEIRRI
jgi:hypothetical protein